MPLTNERYDTQLHDGFLADDDPLGIIDNAQRHLSGRSGVLHLYTPYRKGWFPRVSVPQKEPECRLGCLSARFSWRAQPSLVVVMSS